MTRIEEIYKQIKNLIKNYNPDYISFEHTVFSSNIDTLKQLSQLQGTIIALCIDNDIGFEILYPSEWRKSFGFKGRKREDMKKQAIEYVNSKYGFSFEFDSSDKNGHDDICESICIGEAFLKLIK